MSVEKTVHEMLDHVKQRVLTELTERETHNYPPDTLLAYTPERLATTIALAIGEAVPYIVRLIQQEQEK